MKKGRSFFEVKAARIVKHHFNVKSNKKKAKKKTSSLLMRNVSSLCDLLSVKQKKKNGVKLIVDIKKRIKIFLPGMYG